MQFTLGRKEVSIHYFNLTAERGGGMLGCPQCSGSVSSSKANTVCSPIRCSERQARKYVTVEASHLFLVAAHAMNIVTAWSKSCTL